MGKKKTVEPKKAEQQTDKTQQPGQQLPADTEAKIKAIIGKGKKKGYLTYEEMNAELPDEIIAPARLDTLLATAR